MNALIQWSRTATCGTIAPPLHSPVAGRQSRHPWGRLFARIDALFIFAILFAFGATAQTPADSGFCIELNVFSGVPNPIYFISDPADVSILADRMRVFSDSGSSSSLSKKVGIEYPNKGGYRGLSAAVFGSLPKLPKYFFIYRGTIMIVKGDTCLFPPLSQENVKKIEGKVSYFNDPNFEIEKLFLKIVQKYMNGSSASKAPQQSAPAAAVAQDQRVLRLIPAELLK